MMQAFDGSGGAQQPVQPGVGQHMQREPMPGHMQAPSPAMNVGGHHPMNPPYGQHGGGMPTQQQAYHHGGMSQSPARQGNYHPMQGGGPVGYSSHPPLHSPPSQHAPAPMHAPPMQRQAPGPMQHRVSMGGGHNGNGMGPGMHMPNHHDPMRSSSHSRGGMPPGQPPHFMAQQQQQQHRPPPPPSQGQNVGQNNIMAGSWQSDRDTPHRREMIQCIVKMLRKDKQGSPESSGSSRLPQMAKQLEVSLYRDAPSFEAYRDMSTLKQRLQQIAVEVSRKTRNPGESSSSNPNRQMNSRQPGYPPDPRHNNARSDSASPYGHMPPSGHNPSGHNPNNMNRPMNGNVMPAAPPMQQGNNPHGYDQRNAPGGVPNHQQNGGGRRQNNDPDMKTRIRHKQQRLLLLHHSAKCTAEDGRCTVTPHCSDMKRLWRHMEACKDNQCTVAHCFSSRAILSHYRKCRDPSCPACGPVRETVRKNKTPHGSSSRQPASTGPMMNNMRGVDHLANSANGSYPSSRRTPVNQPPPHQQNGNYNVARQDSQQPIAQPVPPPPPPPQQQQQPPQQPQPYPNAENASFGQDDSTYRHRNGDPARSAGSGPRPVDNAAVQPTMHQPPPPDQNRGGGNEPREQDMQKIRHKQQRLLLLRHASRCQHVSDCPVTPHCASMKQLWEHIAQCKNPECTVQHCMSSRYVLSHYRRCRDARCPVCGPVRDMIKKQSRSDGPQSPGSSINRSSDRNSFDGPGLDDSAAQPMAMQSTSSSPPTQREAKRRKSDMNQPFSSASSMQPAVPSSAPVKMESAPPASKPERVGSKQSSKSLQKGGGDYSLLSSFTIHQLETHLEALNRKTQLAPSRFKNKCIDLLKGLQTHQHGWVFNAPVDPIELNLPDYFDIIKKPMDLGTVQKRLEGKLEGGPYRSIEEFHSDVNMTFDNATTYNEPGSVVYGMAQELKVKFSADYKLFLEALEEEEQKRRQNDKACKLCGCEKLLFEPPVYFCNGLNCQNQRIRRNSHFYIGGNNQYFWCNPCFNELDEKIPIELADMSTMKSDLIKKKNDEVHEESWVHCDSCQSWVHQICGLFNTRQNKEQHSEYSCPKCLLEKRKTVVKNPSPKPLAATDLPRTTLSEWIEKSIMKKVERKKRQLAEEKAQSDSISVEEATRQLGIGGEVIVRQVTAMDRKLEVREMMRKRYAHKNYPEEFPFRCKCIVVFQHLDGVDVVLFALYVYEHGEDNPPPNKRVVYISYLDSVHFMRPRRIRTFVYHEILIAYLDYARKKGFSTAHIWACPPLKGDDYIFYAKPEDQKTPRDSRLRQWYHDMLIESQKRNIVGKVTNMYDRYFANEELDATAVPYLEGDYFPGEAENIIKMLEEGGGKKGGGKKKKNKGNKNKGSTGTRSTGVDEEALLASGLGPSLKDLDRDEVMVKLGETIQAMKESFIVAFLNWSGAKEEDMEVPQEIKDARIAYAADNDDGDMTGSKRDALGMASDTVMRSDGTEVKVIDDDAEDLDCEFLNNRQAFLNLCRGNHYQFDELRRSKHTSMMVLWHLHNRDAPKFVQQCFHCSREILSGKRYHCNVCSDYDLCQDCYSDPKTNRGACNHPLQPIAVESGPTDEGGSRLTDAQRQERQRKLMMHIQLIEHASKCNSKNCSSSNCARMKDYLKHASVCKTKVMGGCKICKRIWTLLRIHAQKCKERNCAIPQCNAIREKMRQLQKQQQAMDDRRRLEMNRHMRYGGGVGGGS